MRNLTSLSVVSSTLLTTGILFTQPANAVIYNWSWTNDTGSIGQASDTISGFVEFSAASFGDLAGLSDVQPINFQITSLLINGVPLTGSPFLGNGDIELNSNLVGDPNLLVFPGFDGFDFDGSSNILSTSNFFRADLSNSDERFNLSNTFFQTNDGGFNDFESDFPPVYTQGTSTPVPFELDATLGILVVGSIVIGSRKLKRRRVATERFGDR